MKYAPIPGARSLYKPPTTISAILPLSCYGCNDCHLFTTPETKKDQAILLAVSNAMAGPSLDAGEGGEL